MMDATALEKDITLGIAATVRAQQLAGPTLDRLIPGIIGDTERQRLREASLALALAAEHCRFAMDSFTEASNTLGAFTRGRE